MRATPWDPSRWAALVGRAVARGSGALGWCTDPWHRDGGLALPLCDALTLGLSRISCQALCYDCAYDYAYDYAYDSLRHVTTASVAHGSAAPARPVSVPMASSSAPCANALVCTELESWAGDDTSIIVRSDGVA